MQYFGFWSVVPPILSIILAIKTRQVYLSLMAGLWFGWLIISGWHPLEGTFAMIQGLVDVFKDEGNTKTIMYSSLVGALLIFIQRSGVLPGLPFPIRIQISKPLELLPLLKYLPWYIKSC